jgi:formylglycine-generating enzyme required for sulfatase activity
MVKKAIIIILAILSSVGWADSPKMILVEAGTFSMGNSDYNDYNNPAHSVTVDSFYMSQYEITFELYDTFCEETGRSKSDDAGWDRGMRPVINVSWNDTIEFCNWLSIKEGLTPCYSGSGTAIVCDFSANGYRLPTEAEWEFAARGGNMSNGYIYSGSDDINVVGWYDENSGNKTHPVGQKRPNELGLYDMTGNTLEWCWGNYYAYTSSAEINPRGNSSGYGRALRGGHWYSADYTCAVFKRVYNAVFPGDPGSEFYSFRPVRSAN